MKHQKSSSKQSNNMGAPLELTPPDIHWQNTAKRGSQTFKCHFISILAGLPDDFPIHQCVKHIPQTILTLNLLRHANVAPNVSVYAYHHSQFNYIVRPLHPLVVQYNFTSNPTDGNHGANIPLMAGTKVHLPNIT